MKMMITTIGALGRGGWVLAMLALAAALSAPALGQILDSSARVTVSAKAARSQVVPGGFVPIAVVFDHEAGWHIHSNKPTSSFAIGTKIESSSAADGPVTMHAGRIQWPKSHDIFIDLGEGPLPNPVFSERAIAYVPVSAAADAAPGVVRVELSVTYQACDDVVCAPPVSGQKLTVELEVVEPGQVAPPGDVDKDFDGFDPSVWAKINAGVAASVDAAAAESMAKSGPGAGSGDADATTPAGSAAGAGAAAAPPGSGPGSGSPAEFRAFGLHFTLDASQASGFALLLATAMFGGFLLNFTPCVLPVIPLKIMGLAQSAGNRTTTLWLGIVMGLGVVAFWMVLGLLISTVNVIQGTGQLFAYPAFTISVGVFIAVMAVGMCGFFTIQLPQSVYAINPQHDSPAGSFLFGVMTGVLATPCTAPFMGAAMAWAASHGSASASLMTFAAIGLGMAAPYVVLAANPAWVSKLPRTGPANELLKQVMGLLMLAAAAYFVGVGISTLNYDPNAGQSASQAYWIPVWLMVAAAGGWLAYRTMRIAEWPIAPLAFTAIGLLILNLGARSAVEAVSLTAQQQTQRSGSATAQAVADVTASSAETHIDWVPYRKGKVREATGNGQVVVLEFTAEWCLNCKVLERTVLHTPPVARVLAEADVVPMKVDLTSISNTEAWEKLKEAGATAPPWLVVYDRQGAATFKSNAYTARELLQAIRAARGKTLAVVE